MALGALHVCRVAYPNRGRSAQTANFFLRETVNWLRVGCSWREYKEKNHVRRFL